jgi:hypothetical protein
VSTDEGSDRINTGDGAGNGELSAATSFTSNRLDFNGISISYLIVFHVP